MTGVAEAMVQAIAPVTLKQVSQTRSETQAARQFHKAFAKLMGKSFFIFFTLSFSFISE